MSKRRRSYSTRARQNRLPDDGIGVYSEEKAGDGLAVLNTPYRRLVFFAGLAGLVFFVVATAMMA